MTSRIGAASQPARQTDVWNSLGPYPKDAEFESPVAHHHDVAKSGKAAACKTAHRAFESRRRVHARGAR